MRFLKILALCGVAAAVSPLFMQAQLPAPATDAQATTDEITTILTQQKTIDDNQSKIDDKLADIAENVRVARIYAARGGGQR